MASEMRDLRLPSQPQSTAPWPVLISYPAEGRRCKKIYPQTATHLCTNWARRRVLGWCDQYHYH